MKKSKLKGVIAKIMLGAVLVSSLGTAARMEAKAASYTFMDTYAATYGYSGNCVHTYMLRDANTVKAIKKDSNIITLGNEMKPDYLLGRNATLITVDEAKKLGYYIPSNYKEKKVPKLHFSTIDEAIKLCYQNDLKMRGHTLVWHSQTPNWLFRKDYTSSGDYVSKSTMDARLEFYIKNVMGHVYSGKYGSTVVYWDVANEIMHAKDSGWEAVYGSSRAHATYVKKAFNFAYEILEQYNLTDSVKLFYNDYNTYDVADRECELIDYINEGKTVCAGIGMQSHIRTDYPGIDKYVKALNQFLDKGYEVQITELDIKNQSDQDLTDFTYKFFKQINKIKKNGGNITCVTWWGPSDAESWLKDKGGHKPLPWSSIGKTKGAYDSQVKAYTDVFGKPGQSAQPTPEATPTPEVSEDPQEFEPLGEEVTGEIADGWYYIRGYESNKYLTVDNYNADGWSNVVISEGTKDDAQKWYVKKRSDGYVNITSKLGDVMLDVANSKDEDGVRIGTYKAYGGTAERFAINETSDEGIYTIGTKISNGEKSFAVYDHQTDDGTKVVQLTNNGEDNQKWKFEKIEDEQAEEPTPAPEETIDDPQPTPEEITDPEPTPETDPQDTPATEGLDLDYTIDNWGSGYQISFKITNNTGSTVNGWTLKISKNQVSLDQCWNVNVNVDGDYYVITPVEWNKNIADGQFVEFGSIGSGEIGDTIDYVIE